MTKEFSKEACGAVVLLGYDSHYFIEYLMEESRVDILNEILELLAIQQPGDSANKNDFYSLNYEAQQIVKSRLDKLEEDKCPYGCEQRYDNDSKCHVCLEKAKKE